MSHPPSTRGDPESLGARRGWLPSTYHYVVILLFFLVNAYGTTDRVVLAVVLQPIKVDLQLSDAEVGLLGFAGAALFAVFGLVAGHLTDAWSRSRLLAISVGIASVATVMCGAVTSFAQLFAARMAGGIGDAGAVPSKYSIVGDLYRPDQRASVLALVQAGLGVGSALGLVLAGVLADQIGWRATFFWFGAPGLLLTLALWLIVRDPPRGQYEKPVQGTSGPSLLRSLGRLLRNRTFLLVVVAYAMTTFSLSGIGYWLPSFLVRSHGLTLKAVGLQYGTVAGAAMLAGLLLSAYISARLLKRDRRWEMWLPGAVNVLVTGTYCLVFTAVDYATALTMLGVSVFLLGMTVGPASAAIQSIVPARSRGLAVAMTMFVSALIGQGLGPWLIGIASDALADDYGVHSLRIALLGATGSLLIGALLYGVGGRSFNTDRVD